MVVPAIDFDLSFEFLVFFGLGKDSASTRLLFDLVNESFNLRFLLLPVAVSLPMNKFDLPFLASVALFLGRAPK